MIRRFYQIDSHPSHRNGGTDSDFTVNVLLPEMTAMEREGLCVVVTKASIPKSYDNVTPGRNTFTLRENATDIKITVPVATYSATDFKTTLQSLLNNATVSGYVYSVAFSTQTGRYRVEAKQGGNPVTPSIIVPDAVGFGIHTILGLVAGSTNVLPFTSTNKVNYQLTAALQLRSDMVSANDNVLAPIYAAETPYASTIAYQGTDLDTLAKPMAQKSSGAYRFYITDIDGQAIELNGGTVAFELLIYTPLAHLQREYMRMRMAELKKGQEPDEKAVLALAAQLRAQSSAGPASDTKTAAAPAAADAPPPTAPDTDTAIETPSLIEGYAELSPDMDGDLVVVPGPKG